MLPLGEYLYQVVQDYSSLGLHRTGTAVDEATIAWFGNELEKCGARVESVPYQFERYVTDSCRLVADDSEIEALPLYYEAIGMVDTSFVHVAELPLSPRFDVSKLERAVAKAQLSGKDAAVFATAEAEGRLVALNRMPRLASGFPAVLAPGSSYRVLTEARINLKLNARFEQDRSETVIGHIGKNESPISIVLSTPLSGWFYCAGERGTGIAITLQLAKELAESWRVTVIGTTGHELECLGLRRFLKDRELKPSAVIHIGANLATGVRDTDGLILNAEPRWAFTNRGKPLAEQLKTLLSPSNFTVFPNPDKWLGEAKEWIKLNTPLLSLIGTCPMFHTIDDIPENVTSPDLLAKTHDDVKRAIDIFLK